jgi:sulfatase maturation enzyme AslB (radical SAM superfamily)
LEDQELAKTGRLDALLAENPSLASRYAKVKSVAKDLVISGYDITNKCNLNCKGCFFFEGDKSSIYDDSASLDDYDRFFTFEVQRGVTMPHFAGAEPGLVPDRLAIAARHWNRGVIYTNGTIPINSALPFKLHVSVWGGKQTDLSLRGGEVFDKAIRAYKGDRRVVFVYTINSQNINEIKNVVIECSKNNLPVTFNYYSPSVWYGKSGESLGEEAVKIGKKRFTTPTDSLSLSNDDRLKAKQLIRELLLEYSDCIIYSTVYDDFISGEKEVYRIDPSTGIAVNCAILNSPLHRQYHTDFSWDDSECCIANVDCSSCRHYVGGYTMAMSSLRAHLASASDFEDWIQMYETWCRLNLVDWR